VGAGPGRSGRGEPSALFEEAGYARGDSPTSESLTRHGFYLPVIPNTNPQPFSFDVLEQHRTIEGIDLNFTIHEPTSSPIAYPALDEVARRYSIETVVGTLGPPTEVLVSAPFEQAEQDAGWTYGLWLHYGIEGLAIVYEGQGLSRRGNLIQVCPSYDGFHSIGLYTRNPAWGLTLEEITEGQALIADQMRSGELVPLGVATGITMEDFHRAFSAPAAEPCLLMPPTGG
jgi:hypothetical protein